MKFNFRKILVSLTVFTLVATILMTFALAGGSCPTKGKGRMDQKCARQMHSPLQRIISQKEEMKLTDEQVTKLKAVMSANQEKMTKNREAMQSARKTLRDAATAEKVDEAAIKAAAQKLGEAIGEMEIVRASCKKAVTEILTPEQQAKITEMRKQFRHKRVDGKGRRHGHGRGRPEKSEDNTKTAE